MTTLTAVDPQNGGLDPHETHGVLVPVRGTELQNLPTPKLTARKAVDPQSGDLDPHEMHGVPVPVRGTELPNLQVG